MRKNTIGLVTAVALVATPLAANAVNLEVYGKARLSIDFANNDDSTAGKEDSIIAVTSNSSRFGFRGDEDLGDGLTAIWQFENHIDVDKGGWGSARDTYLGLKGGFGTFKAGKLSTPYKNSTSKLDIFTDTSGDYNAVIGNINGVDGKRVFDNRVPNTLFYLSPDMKGFQFSAAYVSQYGGDDELPQDSRPDETATSVALTYENGPLYLSAATETLNDYTAQDGADAVDAILAPCCTAAVAAVAPTKYADAEATKISGRWDFGQGTKVGLIWETASKGVEKGNTKESARDAVYLNLSHTSGNNTYKAAFAQMDDLDSKTASGADHFALGIFRALSKTTEIYAMYASTSNDANANYGVKGVSPAAAGKDANVFSFGINKNFSSL